MTYLDWYFQYQGPRKRVLNLFAGKDCFNFPEFSQRANVADRTIFCSFFPRLSTPNVTELSASKTLKVILLL